MIGEIQIYLIERWEANKQNIFKYIYKQWDMLTCAIMHISRGVYPNVVEVLGNSFNGLVNKCFRETL